MFRSHHQALGIDTPRTQGIHNMRRQASAEAARLARMPTYQKFWNSPFVQRGHRNSVVSRAIINAAGQIGAPYAIHKLYDWYNTKPKYQPAKKYIQPRSRHNGRTYTPAGSKLVPVRRYISYDPLQKGYKHKPRRRYNIIKRYKAYTRPKRRFLPPRRRNFRPRQPRYKYKYKYRRRRRY